jgi:glycosyltransferase involved in cell wall biosynthesis
MFDKTIVLVTPWFGRFAGGVESQARSMARELVRRGLSTVVFTTCSSSPFDSWWDDHYSPGRYTIDGVDVRRFATDKNRSGYLSAVRKLQKQIPLSPEEQNDFFDCGLNSKELIAAVKTVLDDRHEIIALPYFYGLTHSLLQTYPGSISLIPCFHDEEQFYWQHSRELLRNAKQVFYNSPEEKEMTIREHGLAVGRRVVEGVVTGEGVELTACEEDDEERASKHLPGSYFVYVGRKDSGKNVSLLCEWFAAYAQTSPKAAKLVFIGGGDDNLVSKNDYFIDLGFVPEATKRRVISGSRALLNLSEHESFSLVLMEAWLLGAPVVVSATSPVTKGHVQRCNGGLFVANQDEFCAALEFLEANEAMRERLARNGQTYVANNFTFDRVLARYLDCFSNEQQFAAAG